MGFQQIHERRMRIIAVRKLSRNFVYYLEVEVEVQVINDLSKGHIQKCNKK